MYGIDRIRQRLGSELGVSDWVAFEQAEVQSFADLADDDQFIHVDSERATGTRFGGTIVHGFFVVSYFVSMIRQVGGMPGDVDMVINYGFDRLRMISPIPVGSRVRGRFTVSSCLEKQRGKTLIKYDVKIEVDGSEKPAIVACWLLMYLTS